MSKSKPKQNYLTNLPIDQLQPNPFQPREKIEKEDIQELKTSVESYGILEPLVVAHTPAGYQIIAGERRWRAAKEAGLDEVPVVVRETSPRGMLEMALVENVQREDLNPLERAKAFIQLIEEFNFTVKSLSKKVGKSRPFISNSLKLLELPDAVKDGLLGGQITEGHARALSSLEDERDIIDCYKILLKEGGTVRRAEALVRRLKSRRKQGFQDRHGSGKNSDKHKLLAAHDKRVKELTKKFHDYLRVPTNIKLVESSRQTKITITLKGNSAAANRNALGLIMKMVSKN